MNQYHKVGMRMRGEGCQPLCGFDVFIFYANKVRNPLNKPKFTILVRQFFFV